MLSLYCTGRISKLAVERYTVLVKHLSQQQHLLCRSDSGPLCSLYTSEDWQLGQIFMLPLLFCKNPVLCDTNKSGWLTRYKCHRTTWLLHVTHVLCCTLQPNMVHWVQQHFPRVRDYNVMHVTLVHHFHMICKSWHYSELHWWLSHLDKSGLPLKPEWEQCIDNN